MKQEKQAIQWYFESLKEKYSFIAITADITDRLFADKVWAMGSHVAMASLFALFPFLICLTSIVGFFDLPNGLDGLVNELFQNWPEEVSAPIKNEIDSILTTPRTGLFTIGFVLAMLFASNGVEALRAALNQAYNDNQMDPRGFIHRRLQSLYLVALGVIGSLMFSVLIILGPSIWSIVIQYVPFGQEFSTLFNLGSFIVTLSILFVCLWICHRILPDKDRSLLDLSPGIGLTLFLWWSGGKLFVLYFENFSNYASTYGGLAGIMSALLFLYLISFVFILGGELNAALIRFRNKI